MRDETMQQGPDSPRPGGRRDRYDEEADRPRRAGRNFRHDKEDDLGGGINTVIPYRNVTALTSYYLGVFALITPFAALLGQDWVVLGAPLSRVALVLGVAVCLAALGLGFLGLRYRGRNPTAGGGAHAWVGIALGTLVLLGLAGVVAFRNQVLAFIQETF